MGRPRRSPRRGGRSSSSASATWSSTSRLRTTARRSSVCRRFVRSSPPDVSGGLLLTLDLGTTNCKAAAFALDGTPTASASVAYPTLSPREGWYEQRPSDWRAAVETSLRQVADALGPAVGDL